MLSVTINKNCEIGFLTVFLFLCTWCSTWCALVCVFVCVSERIRLELIALIGLSNWFVSFGFRHRDNVKHWNCIWRILCLISCKTRLCSSRKRARVLRINWHVMKSWIFMMEDLQFFHSNSISIQCTLYSNCWLRNIFITPLRSIGV